MPRVLSVVVMAITLGLAGLSAAGAHAQVMVPSAQGELAIVHTRQATAVAERVTALMLQVGTDPAYASARDANDLSAAIAGLRPRVAASRIEIRRLASELRGLPTISGPADPVELRMADQVVSDISDFALQIDAYLGVVEDLGDALKAGDQRRVERLAASLVKGSVAVAEGQSLMLRARLPLVPSDSTGFAQVSGLACFYDGFAALQEGVFGIVGRPEAGADMAEAKACMARQIAAGRLALEREAVASFDTPLLERVRDGLVPVHRDMLTELGNGLAILTDARSALVGGGNMSSLMTLYVERTVGFEQRIQALVSREIEVVERLGH